MEAAKTPSETVKLLKLANSVVKKAKGKVVTLWYLPFTVKSGAADLIHSGKLTIFALSDAWYATLKRTLGRYNQAL